MLRLAPFSAFSLSPATPLFSASIRHAIDYICYAFDISSLSMITLAITFDDITPPPCRRRRRYALFTPLLIRCCLFSAAIRFIFACRCLCCCRFTPAAYATPPPFRRRRHFVTPFAFTLRYFDYARWRLLPACRRCRFRRRCQFAMLLILLMTFSLYISLPHYATRHIITLIASLISSASHAWCRFQHLITLIRLAAIDDIIIRFHITLFSMPPLPLPFSSPLFRLPPPAPHFRHIRHYCHYCHFILAAITPLYYIAGFLDWLLPLIMSHFHRQIRQAAASEMPAALMMPHAPAFWCQLSPLASWRYAAISWLWYASWLIAYNIAIGHYTPFSPAAIDTISFAIDAYCH